MYNKIRKKFSINLGTKEKPEWKSGHIVMPAIPPNLDEAIRIAKEIRRDVVADMYDCWVRVYQAAGRTSIKASHQGKKATKSRRGKEEVVSDDVAPGTVVMDE